MVSGNDSVCFLIEYRLRARRPRSQGTISFRDFGPVLTAYRESS
jgi:hypothetical protein